MYSILLFITQLHNKLSNLFDLTEYLRHVNVFMVLLKHPRHIDLVNLHNTEHELKIRNIFIHKLIEKKTVETKTLPVGGFGAKAFTKQNKNPKTINVCIF